MKIIFSAARVFVVVSVILELVLFLDIAIDISMRALPRWWVWPLAFALISGLATAGIAIVGIVHGKLARNNDEKVTAPLIR